MDGGRAEIPHDRFGAARQEREAAELVALPLADLGGGDVADIVDVEEQQGAALRGVERGAGARQAVALQAAEIDPALEIHIGVAGRRYLAIPVPMGGERIAGRRIGGDHARVEPHVSHYLFLPLQLLAAAYAVCIANDCTYGYLRLQTFAYNDRTFSWSQ